MSHIILVHHHLELVRVLGKYIRKRGLFPCHARGGIPELPLFTDVVVMGACGRRLCVIYGLFEFLELTMRHGGQHLVVRVSPARRIGVVGDCWKFSLRVFDLSPQDLHLILLIRNRLGCVHGFKFGGELSLAREGDLRLEAVIYTKGLRHLFIIERCFLDIPLGVLDGCAIIMRLLPEINEAEGCPALFPLHPWVPKVLIVLGRRMLDISSMSLNLIFGLPQIKHLGLHLLRLLPHRVFGCHLVGNHDFLLSSAYPTHNRVLLDYPLVGGQQRV